MLTCHLLDNLTSPQCLLVFQYGGVRTREVTPPYWKTRRPWGRGYLIIMLSTRKHVTMVYMGDPGFQALQKHGVSSIES